MNGLPKMFYKTMPFTIAYGAARKLVHVNNTPVKTNSCKKDKSVDDIYVTTKAAIVLGAGLSSIYLWPYYACKDIHAVEAFIRGDPPADVYDVVELFFK